MPLLLSAVLIWFVITYQKRKNQYEIDLRERKLKEQQLIIERQQALEQERNRIAAEMHDDLGSGLTTINFLSQKARRNQDIEGLDRIARKANQLVQNMSEIIWAMNSRFDDSTSFVAYLRRYTSEYLSENEIPYEILSDIDYYEPINVSGEVRRNLFLVYKELLHNAVKHSGATLLKISFSIINDQVTISILEQGNTNYVLNEVDHVGNGLKSIKDRLNKINFNRTIRYKDTDLIHQISKA